jgi:hypothetical protein
MTTRTGILALGYLGLAMGCAHQAGPVAPVDGCAEGACAPEADHSVARVCLSRDTAMAADDGRIVSRGTGRVFEGQAVPYPIDGSPAPTATLADGSLHVKADIPIVAKAQYVGVFLQFPSCVNASAFTGVRFSIRGRYAGCSIQYGTMDEAHADRSTPAVFASGPRGSYPPQTTLEAGQVGAAAQTISVPFTGYTIAGDPPAPLDPNKLTGVFWQFTVPLADNVLDGSKACTADLTIEDVVFY